MVCYAVIVNRISSQAGHMGEVVGRCTRRAKPVEVLSNCCNAPGGVGSTVSS